MVKDIIENKDYKNLVSKQIKETIDFLLANNQEFSITANIDPIEFNPELPENIKSKLAKYSLFILSNYTYTTIVVSDEFLSFETGFGKENIGSVVKVPLHSIFQVVVDETVVYINNAATVDKFNIDHKSKSMNIFKNNPNNQRFND